MVVSGTAGIPFPATIGGLSRSLTVSGQAPESFDLEPSPNFAAAVSKTVSNGELDVKLRCTDGTANSASTTAPYGVATVEISC